MIKDRQYYIDKAIKKCGGQNALARLIGVSQMAVWRWAHGGGMSWANATAIGVATGIDPARLVGKRER
ncbi:MAG: YdaS family helix-turn-helix protein [Mariprofundaceae bacterium]|jgi:DNA-binding transcriptional regulator YdaS (Cro superfamily)|nr:YdaS family helix-turn-helix protein [Mariprofundaceae bacterium]